MKYKERDAITVAKIECHECERPALYNVWYADTELIVGHDNIAYNSFCLKHAIEDLIYGRNGYQVVFVKLRRAIKTKEDK